MSPSSAPSSESPSGLDGRVDNPSYAVIGVDGGGTKTVAWIASLSDGVILGHGQAGPGNPRAAGFDVALANIGSAIDAAWAAAGLSHGPAAAASLCLSGAGRVSEQDRVRAWAESRQLAARVHVGGDAEPILAAASADHCGIALISGTGSLAWGRNRVGEVARTGGWGYLIGDEGGAYAVALAALRAATHCADGRGPETMLLTAFQKDLGAASPSALIERVYAPEMTRERLAGLAVTVFEAAADDTVARQIVESAADDLAVMVAALVERLGFDSNGYPLAVSGSVLLNQPILRDSLVMRLQDRQRSPAELRLVTDPVRGSVELARRLCHRAGFVEM
jgi:N-acetylglucosamine kinase-like BadF-type ATPase